MQVPIRTITIISDVLDFFRYEGLLRGKLGRGEKKPSKKEQRFIKKMITEVLLILTLYLILFFIWRRFRHLIKAMADVENILNDDDLFGDAVETPKECIEQHRKRECLNI